MPIERKRAIRLRPISDEHLELLIQTATLLKDALQYRHTGHQDIGCCLHHSPDDLAIEISDIESCIMLLKYLSCEEHNESKQQKEILKFFIARWENVKNTNLRPDMAWRTSPNIFYWFLAKLFTEDVESLYLLVFPINDIEDIYTNMVWEIPQGRLFFPAPRFGRPKEDGGFVDLYVVLRTAYEVLKTSEIDLPFRNPCAGDGMYTCVEFNLPLEHFESVARGTTITLKKTVDGESNSTPLKGIVSRVRNTAKSKSKTSRRQSVLSLGLSVRAEINCSPEIISTGGCFTTSVLSEAGPLQEERVLENNTAVMPLSDRPDQRMLSDNDIQHIKTASANGTFYSKTINKIYARLLKLQSSYKNNSVSEDDTEDTMKLYEIYHQLAELKNGLFAGNFNNAGLEMDAGIPANLAIAKFFGFFESLEPHYQDKINTYTNEAIKTQLRYGRENLGSLLYQLNYNFDPKKPTAYQDGRTCIFFIGSELEFILTQWRKDFLPDGSIASMRNELEYLFADLEKQYPSLDAHTLPENKIELTTFHSFFSSWATQILPPNAKPLFECLFQRGVIIDFSRAMSIHKNKKLTAILNTLIDRNQEIKKSHYSN